MLLSHVHVCLVFLEKYYDFDIHYPLACSINLLIIATEKGAITYFNSTAKYPPGYVVQNYDFDWFNFAGIHRPVSLFLCYLYTVPSAAHVDNINITTAKHHQSRKQASV